MDNTVRLWDATKAFDDLETDDFTAATGHVHLQENSQELLLGTYMTKSTPVIHLHFTRRNLLLAAGAYNPWGMAEFLGGGGSMVQMFGTTALLIIEVDCRTVKIVLWNCIDNSPVDI